MTTNCPVDFLIITPLPEELNAVCSKLPVTRELPNEIRACYETDLPCTFADNVTKTFKVIIMGLAKQGQGEAVAATKDAIQRWRPRHIILVGIAGGMPDRDVRLGDIVIADQVVDYEHKKIKGQATETRLKVYPVDAILLGGCTRLLEKPWHKDIIAKRTTPDTPRIHIGPIASGNKVIASRGALVELLEGWSEVIGVEMEAGGVAFVAAEARIPFLMVRGVSDLADENKNSDEVKQWRPYACDAAATFTIALLQSGFLFLPQAEAEQPSQEFIEEQLKRYLPAALYDEYYLHSDESANLLVTQHLTKLLKTVCTYRAAPILAEAQELPHHQQGKWVDATLLFADIYGFTSMSEKLSAKGRAGAEEITQIVNEYFNAMTKVLHENGGFVLRFGGDALLGMFVGLAEETARSAIQASLDMQRRMLMFSNYRTSIGRVNLSMKVGVHTGRVFAAHIGDPEQMEYWVVGKDVNLTAVTEGAAFQAERSLETRGYVVATEAVTRHLRAWSEFRVPLMESPPPDVSLFLIPMTQEFSKLPFRHLAPLLSTPNDLESLIKRLDVLTPYLPLGVLPRLIDQPEKRRVEGEHRLAAILFINVEGLSQLAELLGEARSHLLLETLQDYYITIREIVESHGGVVNKTDLCAVGDKVLAIFGAPRAHEDDASQAAMAALDVQAALVEINQRLAERCSDIPLRLRQRIGLSTGYVFSGNVGAEMCQEYTIMGDNVNLAARLMAAAPWGEIWVSEHTYLWLRDFGDFSFAGKHEMHGIGHVPAYLLSRMDIPFRPRPRFVNRTEILQALQQRLQQVAQVHHPGRVAILRGEPGIGKSHLWQQLSAWAEEKHGYQCLWGHCSQYGATYQPFADILRRYLGLNETDSHTIQRERLAQKIADLSGELDIPRRAPYLSILMGLSPKEEWKSEINRLEEGSPERMQARMAMEMVKFLKGVIGRGPTLIVLEDLHWLNAEAAVILETIMNAVDSMPRLMLGLSLYQGDYTQFAESELRISRKCRLLTEEFDLKALESDYCYQILGDIVAESEISDVQRARICQVSGGNPFYVVENARNLILNPGAEVSPNIQKVIESRIDNLPADAQQVLNVAAVIGNEFSIEELHCALIGELDSWAEIMQGVSLLHSVYLVVPHETHYQFQHQLTREVAYLRQSRESKRRYHQRLGEYWVQNAQPIKAADHYYAAEIWDEATRLGAIAGESCFASYANAEGIRLCLQALEAAQKQPDIEAQIRLYQLLGDLYYRVGQYQNAANYYERKLDGPFSTDAPASEQAAVYCALGAVYDRWGRYDEALEALSKGLSQAGSDPSIIRAKLLRVRCTVLRSKEQLVAAEEAGLQAIAIAAEIPSTSEAEMELAYAHNNLAAVYAAQKREEEALTHYQHALTIRERHREVHKYEYAQSLDNVGMQLGRLERFDEALPYHEKALKIQQEIGDPLGEASVLHNWAWLHWDLTQLEAAEEKFLRALELWTSIEYRKGMAFARQDLGTLYAEQERWEQALEFLNEAVKLYTPLEIHEHLSETCLEQARVLMKLGQLAKAREAAERALEFARKTRNKKKALKLEQDAQAWLDEMHDGKS